MSLEFGRYFDDVPEVDGVPVLAVLLPNADLDSMRQMTDRFRERYASGCGGVGQRD